MTEETYCTGETVLKMTQKEYEETVKSIRENEYEKFKQEFARREADLEDKLHGAYRDLERAQAELNRQRNEHQKELALLKVRHDQLLKTVREMAICLQYEANNGFVNN